MDCPVDAIKVEKTMMIPTPFQSHDGYKYLTFRKGGVKAEKMAEAR